MKNKFSIGDYVSVTAKTYPTYTYAENGNKVDRILATMQFSEPVYGQIIGATFRYEGKYIPAFVGGYLGEDFEPARLINTEATMLYQVRSSFCGKPIEVLEENIALIDAATFHSCSLPIKRSKNKRRLPFKDPVFWAREDRKALSIASKDWPRDKKGRWTKVNLKDINKIAHYVWYTYALDATTEGFPE